MRVFTLQAESTWPVELGPLLYRGNAHVISPWGYDRLLQVFPALQRSRALRNLTAHIFDSIDSERCILHAPMLREMMGFRAENKGLRTQRLLDQFNHEVAPITVRPAQYLDALAREIGTDKSGQLLIGAALREAYEIWQTTTREALSGGEALFFQTGEPARVLSPVALAAGRAKTYRDLEDVQETLLYAYNHRSDEAWHELAHIITTGAKSLLDELGGLSASCDAGASILRERRRRLTGYLYNPLRPIHPVQGSLRLYARGEQLHASERERIFHSVGGISFDLTGCYPAGAIRLGVTYGLSPAYELIAQIGSSTVERLYEAVARDVAPDADYQPIRKAIKTAANLTLFGAGQRTISLHVQSLLPNTRHLERAILSHPVLTALWDLREGLVDIYNLQGAFHPLGIEVSGIGKPSRALARALSVYEVTLVARQLEAMRGVGMPLAYVFDGHIARPLPGHGPEDLIRLLKDTVADEASRIGIPTALTAEAPVSIPLFDEAELHQAARRRQKLTDRDAIEAFLTPGPEEFLL